jgi:hypothetical protein
MRRRRRRRRTVVDKGVTDGQRRLYRRVQR